MTYPSDVSDHQWRLIEPWLPEEKPKGRQRVTNLRDVVSAINYRDQTKCPWRMLPHDFPAWGTVYSYYRRWNQDGTLAKLRNLLKQRPAATSTGPLHHLPQTIDQSA
jgi:transposase